MVARPSKKTPVVKKSPSEEKKGSAKAAARPKAKASALPKASQRVLVERYLRNLPPPIQPLMKVIRKIIKDAAPEAKELLSVGGPVYEANGVFARIAPSERAVLVEFLKGPTPSAETAAGKASKPVRLSVESVQKLQRSVLKSMVREAVALNLGKAPAAAAKKLSKRR